MLVKDGRRKHIFVDVFKYSRDTQSDGKHEHVAVTNERHKPANCSDFRVASKLHKICS